MCLVKSAQMLEHTYIGSIQFTSVYAVVRRFEGVYAVLRRYEGETIHMLLNSQRPMGKIGKYMAVDVEYFRTRTLCCFARKDEGQAQQYMLFGMTMHKP